MKAKFGYVFLGDICDLINGDRGKNYPSREDFIEDGIPFINAGHIQHNNIEFTNMNYISEEKFRSLGSGKIKKNDILYCLRGSLGKHSLVNINEGAIASSLVIIRSKSNDISPKYLNYHLDCNDVYKQQARYNNGSSQPNLSAANVKQFKVYIPKYKIQLKIVNILDKVQSLIDKRKAQIEALDELVKSRFIEMFGDPVLNSKGWKIKKLESISLVGSSKRVFVDELVEKGIPFYRGTEIGSMSTGENIIPTLFITEEHYNSFKESTGVPRIGDLLMPSICPDGRIWRVNTDNPFYFKDGRVLWIHLQNSDVDSIYLQYMLREKFIRDYNKIASGTTFAELKIFALKGIDIMMPPLELQNQFADFVNQIDKLKFEMEKSLKELEDNFNSLMQRAFKGELFN
ncbi:TPA: restriction endonuclease subunit S [Clostridium botulinum]|uniref:restriction endonuclease subunit S n=1 Tax=Clostridium botulinum TaxID=1491 RepID=UPI00099CBEB3|nr:restriction endonuclease subunit S [Clostridium botulinum]NFA96415.1 restriction endonuclease subunit S [Clostridium botulinum]NFB51459.1 restriction endonuclease subunit S [Clostridium botulinum]NFC76882.1 restriction endonuclease subunit S [Clostridium botulinum]NFC87683.1 restriction endonuclease subunit S [Clostridium botulinum]NFD05893.1 restriction endonuclease subunit S [Clostridium botulinum]